MPGLFLSRRTDSLPLEKILLLRHGTRLGSGVCSPNSRKQRNPTRNLKLEPIRIGTGGTSQRNRISATETCPQAKQYLIKDQGSWTLFWHEWASWKRYGRDIKTIQIYYQRSIILYRFHKDPIKDQASWTLFCHEWPF